MSEQQPQTQPTSQTRIPNLVVSQRVLDKMLAAAEDYLQDETGEAMVGLLSPGLNTNGVPTIYILDTIAPDESAVREWATFQQGDETQQERFWWWAEHWRITRKTGKLPDGKRLPEKWDVPLMHVGDWHKQPGHMVHPSRGDLHTAQMMVTDPETAMHFLVAPILTLGYTLTDEPSAQANYILQPRPEGDAMRVDFWYLARDNMDFAAIRPTIYPSEQLPTLPAYPWHMRELARLNAEYITLERSGWRVSPPVLWHIHDDPALDICFLLTHPDRPQALIAVTHPDYPQSPPEIRLANLPEKADGDDDHDDILTAFEKAWDSSRRLANPKRAWSAERPLLDMILALEADGLWTRS